jgi:hypothetical protein
MILDIRTSLPWPGSKVVLTFYLQHLLSAMLSQVFEAHILMSFAYELIDLQPSTPLSGDQKVYHVAFPYFGPTPFYP